MARKLKYNPEDYVGKKFGKWTVLEYLGKNRYNIKYMKCRNKKHGFSRNR